MSIEQPTKDTPWLKTEWDKIPMLDRNDIIQKQFKALEKAAISYEYAKKKYHQYIKFTLISLIAPIIISLIFDSLILFVIGLVMVLVPSIKQINDAKIELDLCVNRFEIINHSQPWEFYHDNYNWP